MSSIRKIANINNQSKGQLASERKRLNSNLNLIKAEKALPSDRQSREEDLSIDKSSRPNQPSQMKYSTNSITSPTLKVNQNKDFKNNFFNGPQTSRVGVASRDRNTSNDK